MLFIKEFNPEFMEYSERLYSRQTLYVQILRYLHIFTLLFVSLRISLTFIFVQILLIIALIMTLSERQNVVSLF